MADTDQGWGQIRMNHIEGPEQAPRRAADARGASNRAEKQCDIKYSGRGHDAAILPAQSARAVKAGLVAMRWPTGLSSGSSSKMSLSAASCSPA